MRSRECPFHKGLCAEGVCSNISEYNLVVYFHLLKNHGSMKGIEKPLKVAVEDGKIKEIECKPVFGDTP